MGMGTLEFSGGEWMGLRYELLAWHGHAQASSVGRRCCFRDTPLANHDDL